MIFPAEQVLSFTLLFLSILVRESHQSDEEENLIHEIFHNRRYNPLVRPVTRDADVLAVTFGAVLVQIINVDEVNELLNLNLWLQILWKDPKLVWNASEYDNINTIQLPSSKLWKPDITLQNRVKYDVEEASVKISSDGTCFWSPLITVVSHCPIDIKWFPFDDQICTLTYESWAFDSTKLDLVLRRDSISLRHYKPSTEWDLVEAPAIRTEQEYEFGTYVNILFRIHIRRRMLAYGFNLIMPCILISMLMVTGFLLPTESGERIGLSVSILLALSVYQLIVLEKIPASGDSLPLLGIYFGSIIIMCVVVIIATIVLINLQHQTTVVPDWFNRWICRLGRIVCVRRRSKQFDEKTSYLKDEVPKSFGSDSQLLDSKKVIVLPVEKSESALVTELTRRLSRAEERKELTDSRSNEWSFVAHVLDRSFMCIFSAYWLVGTTCILLVVPNLRT